MSTTAFILGSVQNFVCETVTFPIQSGGDLVPDGEELTIYAGPWSYRTLGSFEFEDETYYYNFCKSYKFIRNDLGFDYTLDSKTTVVHTFSIITIVMGAIGIVFAYMLPCTKNPRTSMWNVMAGTFIFTALTQGLTLLIKQSSICLDNPIVQYLSDLSPNDGERFPEECTLSLGFWFGVSAVCLYFFAGVFALVVKTPDGSLLSPINLEKNNNAQQKDDGDNAGDGAAKSAGDSKASEGNYDEPASAVSGAPSVEEEA